MKKAQDRNGTPAELPAWFTTRMMKEPGHYGLLAVTSQLFYVKQILAINRDANGELWLDVNLEWGSSYTFKDDVPGATLVGAPTSRTKATIKASHIVAALELRDDK